MISARDRRLHLLIRVDDQFGEFCQHCLPILIRDVIISGFSFSFSLLRQNCLYFQINIDSYKITNTEIIIISLIPLSFVCKCIAKIKDKQNVDKVPAISITL